MKLVRTLIIISICFWGNSIEAQKIDTFSIQPKLLIENLETHMLVYKKPKIEETLKSFEKMLKQNALTEVEMKDFTTMLNKMVKLKLSVGTYFRPYIASYIENRKQTDETNLANWNKIVESLMLRTGPNMKKELGAFLKFSELFSLDHSLKKNTGGTTWTYSGDNYKYDFKEEEPILKLEKIDLITYRKEDTVRIKQTSGYVDIKTNTWYGNGGKIDWQVVNLDPAIYCTLKDYKIEFKKGNYEAKNVTFFYPEYFGSEGIEGHLKNRFESGKNKENNNPQFESKAKVLKIDNFANNVQFTGGFKLKGNKIYGYGTRREPAVINISLDGQQKLIAKSSNFTLKKENNRILSKAADIKIHLKEGSITHPSAALRYDIEENKIKLSRGTRGRNGNPFIDDYHNVDITVNDITYYIEKDSILIGEKIMGLNRADDEAVFRSVDFFSEDIFDRFQNISDNNPVVVLKLYCEQQGTNNINASGYAKMLNSKNTSKSITSLLYEMVEKGFILYDDEIDSIQVFDKVKLYSDASRGNVDYDLIQLNSVATQNNNGHMIIGDQDLLINDIKNFTFSRKKKVAGKPYNQKLTLKKNRNLEFDGSLFAGKAIIEGKKHQFKYDEFKILTDSTRTINFYLNSGKVDEKGKPKFLSIGSKLENTMSTILIDAPNNKSGKENIDIFPTLKTTVPSFVYYDKNINHGSYNRDSFYFELKPFVLNKLKNLVDVQMNFDGKLYSNGIFPEFEETITLQGEEQILGFVSPTPTNGYTLYKDKGTYKGDISLDIKGLKGVGDVNFLNAHFYSEDIQFLLDSLQANSLKFDIKERRNTKPEIPYAYGEDVRIDWLPYKDSMYVKSKEKPFNILTGGTKTLDGLLIVTSEGVKANGMFKWDEGQFSSKLMSFDANKVYADTASMKINAFEKDDFAFDTRNVNGILDFDKKEGHFKANDDESNTLLPYNQYKTSMNAFDWDMEKSIITFRAKENSLGVFTSIHKDQDSLSFGGKSAIYELKNNILKVDGVPFVRSADAFIYPESSRIIVEPAAKITRLKNATIKADTLSQYHVITKANIDINGLKDFKGDGYYSYDIGTKKQEIFFENVTGSRVGKGKRAEKKTETRGDGEIDEEANFYMDHHTRYKGTIQLKSSQKNLMLHGFAQIDALRIPSKNWFSYKGKSDKSNPITKFEYPLNEEGTKLYTGFYLSKDFDAVYPSVIAPLSYVQDRKLMDISGVFDYNETTDEYVFGDSLKVLGNQNGGSKLTFSNQKGTIEAEGKINICEHLEDVSINASGILNTNIPIDSIDYDKYEVSGKILAALDFYIPKPLLEIIARDFNTSLFDAKNINPNLNKEAYKNALMDIFPKESDQKNILGGLDQNVINVTTKSNNFALLFGLVDMKWDGEFQAFISTKIKNDLISVNGQPVNKKIESYIEYKMPYDNKDRFYVYIKSTTGNYYYFVYSDHVLSTVSNNVRYNDAVLNLGKKEKRKKIKGGEYIEVEPTNPGSAENFKSAIKEAM